MGSSTSEAAEPSDRLWVMGVIGYRGEVIGYGREVIGYRREVIGYRLWGKGGRFVLFRSEFRNPDSILATSTN